MRETKIPISPTAVGLNGVALDAAKTSNTIDTTSASEVTVHYKTAARVAFTALHFEVDWLAPSDGTARESMGISDSSVSGSDLVHTLTPDKYTRTTSATVSGECFTIPVKGKRMKIRASATAGDATDLIYVELELIQPA